MSKVYYGITYVGVTRYVNEGNFESVYDKIMFISDNHELAAEVSSWCELASIGEVYEGDNFTVEIIEDIE